MFMKLLQLNLSSTVFDTDMKPFLHCFSNNSNRIFSSQLLKLQQNSLTQVNDDHWRCSEHSEFNITPQKKAP